MSNLWVEMPRIDGGRYEASSSTHASYYTPLIQGVWHRISLVSPSVDTRLTGVAISCIDAGEYEVFCSGNGLVSTVGDTRSLVVLMLHIIHHQFKVCGVG